MAPVFANINILGQARRLRAIRLQRALARIARFVTENTGACLAAGKFTEIQLKFLSAKAPPQQRSFKAGKTLDIRIHRPIYHL
jgi:hypothetical protein